MTELLPALKQQRFFKSLRANLAEMHCPVATTSLQYSYTKMAKALVGTKTLHTFSFQWAT